jgi:hypothetical protein
MYLTYMIKKNKPIKAPRSKILGAIKVLAALAIAYSLFIVWEEENLFEMSPIKNAFLTFMVFIAVCAGIYYSVLTFFSFISGWIFLSRRLPAPETVQSDSALFYSQSVNMGFMDYRMSVNIRFTDTGLIFSQSRFFTFRHKPFIIPYEKIGNFTKIDSSDSDLEFAVEGIKIRMSGESAEALNKKKLNPSLPIVSLKLSKDDVDRSMKRGERRLITRQCRFDELQPVFIREVRDFIKNKKPGNLKSTILHCYETTYMEKNFFLGIVYHQYTDLVITPEWFIWGVSDGDGNSTGCAKIKDIAKTHDFEKILISNPLEIRGINITNFHYDESQLNSWRIKVGNDKDGKAFRQELVETVKKYSK